MMEPNLKLISRPVIVIAFDPGKEGGIVAIRIHSAVNPRTNEPEVHKEILWTHRMPLISKDRYNWMEIKQHINTAGIYASSTGASFIAVCEQIHSRKGFRIDMLLISYGGIQSALSIEKIDTVIEVTPSSWKKRLEFPVGSEKEYSIQVAKQLFPETIDSRLLYPSDRCINESDGIADALCIAWAGYLAWRERLEKPVKEKKPRKTNKVKNGESKAGKSGSKSGTIRRSKKAA